MGSECVFGYRNFHNAHSNGYPPVVSGILPVTQQVIFEMFSQAISVRVVHVCSQLFYVTSVHERAFDRSRKLILLVIRSRRIIINRGVCVNK